MQVQGRGGHTVIYLLPGLTPVERRAALQRTRSSARIGHGPALSAAGLARAVVADRVRTVVRGGAAACHAHPALCIPPMIIVVSVAAAYLLLASVSIRIRPPATAPPPRPVLSSQPRPDVAVPASLGSAGSSPPDPASPGEAAAGLRGQVPQPQSGPRGLAGGDRHSSAPPWPVPSLSSRPAPSAPPPPRASSSPPSRSSPSPSPSRSPSRSPSPSPSRSRSRSPSPSSSPAPAGRDSGGACLNVGPLGVCVNL